MLLRTVSGEVVKWRLSGLAGNCEWDWERNALVYSATPLSEVAHKISLCYCRRPRRRHRPPPTELLLLSLEARSYN